MTSGLLLSLSAFLVWGILPLYWVQFKDVSPLVVLASRIVSSLIFVFPILWLHRCKLRVAFTSKREWLWILSSTFLIGFNWYVFVVCMVERRIIECSLAYFITPLMSVFLGVFFLRERLSKWQWFSIAIAAFAVAYLMAKAHAQPWYALLMAVSFACYGVIKKKTSLKGLISVSMEAAILSPVMVIVLFKYLPTYPSDIPWALLATTGLVTLVPLVFYAYGVERLDYSLVGFLQYIAPVIQFYLAIIIFKESFSWPQKIAFGLIAVALIIFLTELGMTRMRRLKRVQS